MSCCDGKCGCGADRKCGNGCRGCKMSYDLSHTESIAPTISLLSGVAPQKMYYKEIEVGVAAENGGCKCRPDCKCDPCNCK